jgi:hypothetical protein
MVRLECFDGTSGMKLCQNKRTEIWLQMRNISVRKATGLPAVFDYSASKAWGNRTIKQPCFNPLHKPHLIQAWIANGVISLKSKFIQGHLGFPAGYLYHSPGKILKQSQSIIPSR